MGNNVGSTIAIVRKALFEQMQHLPGLAGATVDYWPAENDPRIERIYLGPEVEGVDADVRAHSNQDGTKLIERYRTFVFIDVASKTDGQPNEERAIELLNAIIAMVSTDPTLGLRSQGVQHLTFAGVRQMGSAWLDTSPFTRVEAGFDVTARINT